MKPTAVVNMDKIVPLLEFLEKHGPDWLKPDEERDVEAFNRLVERGIITIDSAKVVG